MGLVDVLGLGKTDKNVDARLGDARNRFEEREADSTATIERLTAERDEALGRAHQGWQIIERLTFEGVFISDPDMGAGRDGNAVIYQNAQGGRMLGTFGGALRQAFNIDVAQVKGGSIHRFHQNPDRIRGILGGLREGEVRPNADIPLGENTVQTFVSRLTHRGGETVGFLLTMVDVTSERRTQTFIETVPVLAENVSAGANSVSEIAKQTAEAPEQIARDAQEQQTGVQSTLESVEQMARVITDVANSAQSVAANSAKAVETAEVQAEVGDAVKALAPGGGFVFAGVHNIQAQVPTANLLAMFDGFAAVRDYAGAEASAAS